MFSFKKKSPPEPIPGAFDFIGVDIHNHLLPGIDDGSPESLVSVQYIKELTELGFSEWICTPHILPGVHNNTRDTILDAHKRLEQALIQHQVSVPMQAAAEYMLDTEMFEGIRKKTLLTLKDNYVLIEMSYMSAPPNLDELLFELLINDYKPVLAHPERYSFYKRDLDRLEQLRDRGCLFQVNLASFTGYYGKDVKEIAFYLLKNNLLDLAGTDLHHERHLEVFKQMSGDRKLMEQLQGYGFKNRELFGTGG